MLIHIVAHDLNRGIGINNKLPWNIPADLKRFKGLTTNNTVIMGRKTFESIGKELPNRQNLIVSRSGLGISDAINSAEHENIYIIGGGEIYAQTIDIVDRIELTLIKSVFDGVDAFYPVMPDCFIEVNRVAHSDYDFVTYEKFIK